MIFRVLLAVLVVVGVMLESPVVEAAPRRSKKTQKQKSRSRRAAPKPAPPAEPPAEAEEDTTPEETTPAATPSSESASSSAAGTLSVRSNESGATVLLDGKPLGETPLKGAALPAGEHLVTLEKDGFISASQKVEAEGPGEVVVRLALEPTEEVRSAHARKVGIMRGVGVALLAVGGLLAAVTLAAGVGGATLWVASVQARTFERFGQGFTDPASQAVAPYLSGPLTLYAGIGLTLVAPVAALLLGSAGAVLALVLFALAGDGGRYGAFSE